MFGQGNLRESESRETLFLIVILDSLGINDKMVGGGLY